MNLDTTNIALFPEVASPHHSQLCSCTIRIKRKCRQISYFHNLNLYLLFFFNTLFGYKTSLHLRTQNINFQVIIASFQANEKKKEKEQKKKKRKYNSNYLTLFHCYTFNNIALPWNKD